MPAESRVAGVRASFSVLCPARFSFRRRRVDLVAGWRPTWPRTRRRGRTTTRRGGATGASGATTRPTGASPRRPSRALSRDMFLVAQVVVRVVVVVGAGPRRRELRGGVFDARDAVGERGRGGPLPAPEQDRQGRAADLRGHPGRRRGLGERLEAGKLVVVAEPLGAEPRRRRGAVGEDVPAVGRRGAAGGARGRRSTAEAPEESEEGAGRRRRAEAARLPAVGARPQRRLGALRIRAGHELRRGDAADGVRGGGPRRGPGLRALRLPLAPAPRRAPLRPEPRDVPGGVREG